ncbi:MAG: hypothetical protein Q9212_004574 [Teloschistes hypoglaucus]
MTTNWTQTGLAYRPDLSIRIAQVFFGLTVPQKERIYALKQYFVYFSDELKLLSTGISKESWQIKDLAIKNCEELFHVVDVLRTNQEHRRPEIRQKLLSRFSTSNDLAINRSLNLALRLWLMINVQEPAFAGLKHGVMLPLPVKVLQETILSLDLLFPFWDSRTINLLAKEKQDFHEYGPFQATRRLTLLDFDHWRDRLLELDEEIFQSPPVSWAQLWRDRRSPQQFWTFWIAIMILILTFFSTIATIVQAWASLRALDRLS